MHILQHEQIAVAAVEEQHRLQQLLNEPLSSASDLEGLTLTELDERISALQSRLQKN
jgi:uncharacterized small protein (DUF1192 family)